MTNAQKKLLKDLVQTTDNRPTRELAELVGCSMATVRQYKKIFCKKRKP
jgi:hypothetical protein